MSLLTSSGGAGREDIGDGALLRGGARHRHPLHLGLLRDDGEGVGGAGPLPPRQVHDADEAVRATDLCLRQESELEQRSRR